MYVYIDDVEFSIVVADTFYSLISKKKKKKIKDFKSSGTWKIPKRVQADIEMSVTAVFTIQGEGGGNKGSRLLIVFYHINIIIAERMVKRPIDEIESWVSGAFF